MKLYGEVKTERTVRMYEREFRKLLHLPVRNGDITEVVWQHGFLRVTFVQAKGVSVTL